MPHVLIIEAEQPALECFAEFARQQGYQATLVRSVRDARTALLKAFPDVVVVDLLLPDGDGMELVRELEKIPLAQVIVVTACGTVETAVEAMRMGVADYLTKPVEIPRLKAVFSRVARTIELQGELRRLRAELKQLGRFGLIVGSSPPMQALYDLAIKVAPTEATVLITGESGTGKELLAQTVHALSKRRRGPLLPVNCGAISPTLMESQLFGHERGSFTGADRTHHGYFERADGGTLFLDEICELPVEFQVKLLRVLETSTFTRVGGEEPIRSDVRLIAATNRSPEAEMAAGRLRDDLFYRLQGFRLDIPPLRERPDDVVVLATHFLAMLNRDAGTAKTLDDETLRCLRRAPWPGNVRELQNAVQHAFILGSGVITPACLPSELQPPAPTHQAAGADGNAEAVPIPVGISLADAQRRLLLATLERYDGDKRKAARTLGVSLKTVYNRLNAYRSTD